MLPNLWERAETPEAFIAAGDLLDHGTGVCEPRVEVGEQGEQGRDDAEQPAGQGQGADAAKEGSALPEGIR